MKPYTKPTIEFIELRPEERLACNTGNSSAGCCTGGNNPYQGYYYLLACWKAVPIWIVCDILKKKNVWFC
ncbi:MAG TPA: hypothetical protein VIM13_11725 [Clostridia bacterium]